MDPDAALKWCRESISRGDFETAIAHFQSLDRWMQNGGLIPESWNRHRRATL